MFFGNSSIQFDFTERYSLRQILFEGRPLLASRSGNELFVLSFVDCEGNPSRLSSADFLTVQAFSGKEVLRVIFSGHNAMPGLKAVVAVRLQDGEPAGSLAYRSGKHFRTIHSRVDRLPRNFSSV